MRYPAGKVQKSRLLGSVVKEVDARLTLMKEQTVRQREWLTVIHGTRQITTSIKNVHQRLEQLTKWLCVAIVTVVDQTVDQPQYLPATFTTYHSYTLASLWQSLFTVKISKINNKSNYSFIISRTRRMYWRRASVQDGQAFTSAWWQQCSETGFPQ